MLPGNWRMAAGPAKLGELEDVEHTLDGLVGTWYGSVVQVFKRPLSTPPRDSREQEAAGGSTAEEKESGGARQDAAGGAG
jgi:hypothetical protein